MFYFPYMLFSYIILHPSYKPEIITLLDLKSIGIYPFKIGIYPLKIISDFIKIISNFIGIISDFIQILFDFIWIISDNILAESVKKKFFSDSTKINTLIVLMNTLIVRRGCRGRKGRVGKNDYFGFWKKVKLTLP
jgi:hypothetical protein